MLSILQRYVSKSYISAWFLGMLVLTFVLSIGLLVKATQLVVKGLPAGMVMRFIAVSFPESLSFTLPLASLVSALLLFGRLSSDGETSAMRACGVDIRSVMAPLAVFGVALSFLSVYINAEVAPQGAARRHDLINSTTRTKDIVKLLEPGHYIHDFNGVDLWFESRDGDTLNNLIILEKTKSGGTRETRCEKAEMEMLEDGNLMLDMYKVRITPFSEKQPGTATVGHLRHVVQNDTKPRTMRRKVGDLTSGELKDRIAKIDASIAEGHPDAALTEDERNSAMAQYARKLGKQEVDLKADEIKKGIELLVPQVKSSLLTEYHRRLAFGLAPLAFILLGMPLGMRTSRKESNIGIAISLGVMLLYYAFMVGAKSLSKYPEFYPHIVIWTPTAICLAIAVVLVRKNQ